MENLLAAAESHADDDTVMASGYQTPPHDSHYGTRSGKSLSGTRGGHSATMRPSPSMSMASPQLDDLAAIDHDDEHSFMPTMDLNCSPQHPLRHMLDRSPHTASLFASSSGYSIGSLGPPYMSPPSSTRVPPGGALSSTLSPWGARLDRSGDTPMRRESSSSSSLHNPQQDAPVDSFQMPTTSASSMVMPLPPVAFHGSVRGSRTLTNTDAFAQSLFGTSFSSSAIPASSSSFGGMPPTPPTPSKTATTNQTPNERGKERQVHKSRHAGEAERCRTLRSGRTVNAEGKCPLDTLINAALAAPRLITAAYVDYDPRPAKQNKKSPSQSRLQVPGGPWDGVVMSSTRREWQSMLGHPSGAGADVIKGHVAAVGSLISKQGDELRNMIVVRPEEDKTPNVNPSLRIDIRKLTQVGVAIEGFDPPPTKESDSVGPPLARPSFSPFVSGLVALATEQHPLQESSGAILLVANVQKHPKTTIKLAAPSLFLPDPVSAMDWLSTKELLVATGRDLLIVSIGEHNLRNRLVLPSMHIDDIRDLQLSSFSRNMALTGGYDGRVYITDCERVVSDQMSYRSHSSNTLYDVGKATVSSVQWNPIVANFASITTDSGFMHCFDTRLGNDRPTVILKTGVPLLYTHGWADSNAVLLGYGDGTLRLFDMRKVSQCVCAFSDPHVCQSGDIVFDPQRRFFVNFGSPGFSVWRNESSCLSLHSTDLSSFSSAQVRTDKYFKQSGAFLLTGGRHHAVFGTTDAHGFFSIYDVMSAGEASIDLK